MKTVTKLQLAGLVSAIRMVKQILAPLPITDPRYQAAVTIIDKSGYPNILAESAAERHAGEMGHLEMAKLLVSIKGAAEGSTLKAMIKTMPLATLPASDPFAISTIANVEESPATETAVITAPQIPVDEDDEERLLREARAKRKAAEASALAQAQAVHRLTEQVSDLVTSMKLVVAHSKEVENEAHAAQQEARQAKAEADQLRRELAAKPAVTPVQIEVNDEVIQKAVDARLAKALRDTLGITATPPADSGTGSFELRSVTVPMLDKGYVLDEAKEKLLNVALDKARLNIAENILLTGPTGCGKTSAIEQFCAKHGLPMLMMSCPNQREVRDWFGAKSIEGGTIKWIKSQFQMAVSAGNCVIVLDELNRTTPYVANGLMPLLDHRRAVLIEEIGEIIKVGAGVLFVGTINEGGAYTGTHGMDLAARGRFGLRIECDYLAEKEEIEVLVKKTGIKKEHAKRLVQFAKAVRAKAGSMDGAGLTGTVSTRQLITASEYLAKGGTSTLEFTIVNHFDGVGGVTSERAQVVAMLEGKFPELKGSPAPAEAENTPAPAV